MFTTPCWDILPKQGLCFLISGVASPRFGNTFPCLGIRQVARANDGWTRAVLTGLKVFVSTALAASIFYIYITAAVSAVAAHLPNPNFPASFVLSCNHSTEEAMYVCPHFMCALL